MNGGPNAPTTADYADARAQDNHNEIGKVLRRIEGLEQQMAQVTSILEKLTKLVEGKLK